MSFPPPPPPKQKKHWSSAPDPFRLPGIQNKVSATTPEAQTEKKSVFKQVLIITPRLGNPHKATRLALTTHVEKIKEHELEAFVDNFFGNNCNRFVGFSKLNRNLNKRTEGYRTPWRSNRNNRHVLVHFAIKEDFCFSRVHNIKHTGNITSSPLSEAFGSIPEAKKTA